MTTPERQNPWQTTGLRLASLLDLIEPFVAAEVKSAAESFRITRNHSDRPQLDVRWSQGDGLLRAVQITLTVTGDPQEAEQGDACVEG